MTCAKMIEVHYQRGEVSGWKAAFVSAEGKRIAEEGPFRSKKLAEAQASVLCHANGLEHYTAENLSTGAMERHRRRPLRTTI